MPGVMAYGETRESAIAAVHALALRVAADCIEHGEAVPAPLRIGWTIAWQKGSQRVHTSASAGTPLPSNNSTKVAAAQLIFLRRWIMPTGRNSPGA